MASRKDPRPTDTPLTPKSNDRYQMADLARLAGVSTSTVSRALADNPLIKDATRRKIQSLAQTLNYQINKSAASLRKRDIPTMGLVIMGESKQSISDPFILSLIGHIADALDELDMNMLLTRVTPDRAKNFAALYETGQVAGLLVIGQLTNHSQLNDLYHRGIPMVVWGARMPDSHYPVVGGDNFQGGLSAGQHLVQAGCKHIAFLGDIKHPEVQMRHAGFVKALTDVGQSFDPRLHMPLLFGDTALRSAIGQWIDQKIEFDGVFATSDVAALTIIAELQERGLKVPRDVKVVGYDDIPLSTHIHPTLTSIRQPTELAGRAMVALMRQRLQNADVDSVTLPTTLVARESTGLT
jgi:DNA-binding LacI/PurR family transcriptional regulator